MDVESAFLNGEVSSGDICKSTKWIRKQDE